MKSKRRHELQTNELADQLGHWIERVRPYTNVTLIVVAGGLLVLAAWYYLASGREKKLAESWRSYMLASTNLQGDAAEDLSLVADQFADMQAGQWAALTAADYKAYDGTRLMFTDRAAAETALNTAKSHYRSVLGSEPAAQDAMLSSRARFGLAQVLETQSELEEATEEYARVVESSHDSALGKAAQHRIDRLGTTTTKKWYNWFANQKPAPRNLGTGPTSGSSTGLPDTDLEMVPDVPAEGFLKGDAPVVPAADVPATEPAKPAEDAATGPAMEPPAEPAKVAPAEPTQNAPAESAPEAPAGPAQDAPADQPPPG